MPAEKPLTEADIKPGVRVRGPGGNVFRIVAVGPDGVVSMALEDDAPEYERDASRMLEPMLNGSPRYTVVETPDAPLHLLRDGTHGTTLEALHEAQREVEARDARIADLEREKAALFDCGQDGVCAIAPGCVRHFAEQARTLLAERDLARSMERTATERAIAHASDIAVSRIANALNETRAVLGAAPLTGADDSELTADAARRVVKQRDTFAAGLREALDKLDGWERLDQWRHTGSAMFSPSEALARLRTLAESFHPTAQPAVTTGESGSGIVSGATESSVATVDRGADDAWAAKELRFILDDVTFDERHGDDGRRAVEHAIKALAP